MNTDIAKQLLKRKLQDLSKMSYSDVSEWRNRQLTEEVLGEDGERYQIEVQVFPDRTGSQDLRLVVSIDDGGWRVLKPLTGDLVFSADQKRR